MLERFQLTLVDVPDLFADVGEMEASPLLHALLPEFYPLALAINTEKARSELLIAPLLAALRAQLGHRFSFFSGIDFTVDPAQGLAGYCDFILSLSPEQQFLRSPVAAIVEAKNENLKAGLGQCIAAMMAARLYNEREGEPGRTVFGAVTSGSLWRFLRLQGNSVGLDEQEYHLHQLPKILGILASIVGGLS
ncbi:MAG: hypothetical protein ACRELG_13005 [Gemmataceae bacterium]